MDNHLPQFSILEGNSIPLTIHILHTFILKSATFKHISISIGQNSNHKVEKNNEKDEQIEPPHHAVDVFLAQRACITVVANH